MRETPTRRGCRKQSFGGIILLSLRFPTKMFIGDFLSTQPTQIHGVWAGQRIWPYGRGFTVKGYSCHEMRLCLRYVLFKGHSDSHVSVQETPFWCTTPWPEMHSLRYTAIILDSHMPLRSSGTVHHQEV